MQCLNCGFENMPGLSSCGRCESRLDFGEVSVIPDRASSLRVATHAARVRNRIRGRLGRLASIRLPRWGLIPSTPIRWPAVARSIIPGWGQLYLGHRLLGWSLLIAWLFFILVAALAFPGGWTTWMIMGAVTVQTASIVSIHSYDLAAETVATRALVGLILFLGIWQLIYQPLGRLMARAYTGMVVPSEFIPGPVVGPGDAIIYEGAWNRPSMFSRGDLVVYNIREKMGSGFVIRSGLGLDRIVGLPGDTVDVREGTIRVNGTSLPLNRSTLGSIERMPSISMVLDTGEYAIFPTRVSATLGPHAENYQAQFVQLVSRVGESDILGRVRYRLHPCSRFGPVR